MEINTEKIRTIEKSNGFFEITYENDLGLGSTCMMRTS